MGHYGLKKSSKTITICWKPIAEGDAIVLYDGYLKDIATTFSSFVRSKFPTTKFLTLAQMQVHRKPSCVTITHPKRESVKKILGWMIDCCSGTGLKQYKIEKSKPVANPYFDLGVATYLGIPYLVNKINTYINHRLTTGHLPAIEVQTLLESTTLQDPIFDVLVQHVASRVWQDMQARRRSSQN